MNIDMFDCLCFAMIFQHLAWRNIRRMIETTTSTAWDAVEHSGNGCWTWKETWYHYHISFAHGSKEYHIGHTGHTGALQELVQARLPLSSSCCFTPWFIATPGIFQEDAVPSPSEILGKSSSEEKQKQKEEIHKKNVRRFTEQGGFQLLGTGTPAFLNFSNPMSTQNSGKKMSNGTQKLPRFRRLYLLSCFVVCVCVETTNIA